jgi:hypothetical protein
MIAPVATSTTAAFSAFQSSGLHVLSHAPDKTLRQIQAQTCFALAPRRHARMVTAADALSQPSL